MERLRTFTVTVDVETSKRGEKRTFNLDDYDSTDDLWRDATEWVEDVAGGVSR